MIDARSAKLSARTSLAILSLTLLAGLIAMLPRFARQDRLFGWSFQHLTTTTLGDAEHYIQMVQHYRGLGLPPGWPFAFRPLTPYLASWLPFEPVTALAIIGLAGGLLAILAVFLICRELSCDWRAIATSTGLFALSFPMFYYATVGITDAMSIGLSALAVWLCLRRLDHLAIAALVLSIVNREASLITIAFLVPAILSRGLAARNVVTAIAVIAAALAAVWITRMYLSPPLSTRGLAWALWDWPEFSDNLIRPRFYVTQIAGLGLQGLIVIACWLRGFKLDLDYFLDPWKWGVAAGFAMVLYGMNSGPMDGKFLWTTQVYTCAVLTQLLTQWWAAGARPASFPAPGVPLFTHDRNGTS